MFHDVDPPKHLAYVEWFIPFSAAPDQIHGMYKVSHSMRSGVRESSVVEISSIKRSVHLFPLFGRVAPRDWTASNVLQECKMFYLNPFSDRHAYVTMY